LVTTSFFSSQNKSPKFSSFGNQSLKFSIRIYATATQIPSTAIDSKKRTSYTSLVPPSFLQRMGLTAEIAISKLFPGGFGWQLFSVGANHMGYGATDAALWLMTGVGDMLGVFFGHLIYMAVKKSILPSKKTMFDEFAVALWLGTAAFCSGTIWQPSVNTAVGFGFSFPMVAMLVTLSCTLLFFIGLRIGRRTYSGLGIEGPKQRNFSEDAGLAFAIGGAGGMFVGTDVTIPKNCFDSFVGVYPDMTPIQGCVKAGTSTAVGFSLFHAIQNSRAQSSNYYMTKEGFSDVVNVVVKEYQKSRSLSDAKTMEWVENETNIIFSKYDNDGDGRLAPEELKKGLGDLQISLTKQGECIY